MIPSAPDLEGCQLTVAREFRESNPRRPFTHGWLAFEVLRRASGGTLSFNAYAARLFNPDPEIRELARRIPGEPNAYQHFKHIRCDIYRRAVTVSPALPDEWFKVSRCSPGGRPYS
jgi:hypothetical protein